MGATKLTFALIGRLTIPQIKLVLASALDADIGKALPSVEHLHGGLQELCDAREELFHDAGCTALIAVFGVKVQLGGKGTVRVGRAKFCLERLGPFAQCEGVWLEAQFRHHLLLLLLLLGQSRNGRVSGGGWRGDQDDALHHGGRAIGAIQSQSEPDERGHDGCCGDVGTSVDLQAQLVILPVVHADERHKGRAGYADDYVEGLRGRGIEYRGVWAPVELFEHGLQVCVSGGVLEGGRWGRSGGGAARNSMMFRW